MGLDSGMEDGYDGYKLKYDNPEYWKRLYDKKNEECKECQRILKTAISKLKQLSETLERISNV